MTWLPPHVASNVASVTEERKFYFHFNVSSHMWWMATVSDSEALRGDLPLVLTERGGRPMTVVSPGLWPCPPLLGAPPQHTALRGNLPASDQAQLEDPSMFSLESP